ncbi:unnamed protein product [Heligmosomoides polygyrus]|uniref:Procollagen-lysine 5-dioxygenase n=1 Tax=Heligmosomoides polygyrus TaxID=6339 RepID=A0A183GBZ7_HELPZ|nr:unnamed protein product [Heligmosomoides polygyrus]
MLLWLVALLLPSLVWCEQKQKLLVFTVATENTDGLRRLLKSADTYDIKIQVLGMGDDWNGGDTRTSPGGGQKIRLLREALKPYQKETDTLILFVDAYDVVFTAGIDTIIDRLAYHFEGKRVVFSAEPYCWPDESLAVEYPVVDFGKR